jgi:hypothetical protein
MITYDRTTKNNQISHMINNLKQQIIYYDKICRNPSFGLVTKTRAYKSAGQEGGLGGTSYTPRSVGECERMSFHTPK